MSNIWALSRESTGRSREYIADELGVSPNTVTNWERGTSAPNILQALDWFDVLGVEPYRYFLDFRYPDIFAGLDADSDMDAITAALHQIVRMTPDVVQRQWVDMMLDDGIPFQALQAGATLYFKLSMPSRVILANSMAGMHDTAAQVRQLRNMDKIRFSRELLDTAVNRAKKAAMLRQSGYTNALLRSHHSDADRAQRATMLSALWSESRAFSGATREHMALELGVSPTTVRNWENGKSLPNLLQSFDWFDVAQIEPFKFFMEFKYRAEFSPLLHAVPAEDVSEKLHSLVDAQPEVTRRQMLNMVIGGHGTPFIPFMQFTTMILELPTPQLVNFIRQAEEVYDIEEARGTLVNQDHVGFSREGLDYALEKALSAPRLKKINCPT